MPIGSLWIAVVVSAVVVFFLSFLFHMVLPWHKSDYKGLKNEDEVRAAISKGSPAPGYYFVPAVMDMKKLKEPDVIKKFVDGPVAHVTVRPNGPPTMGSALVQWFLFCLFTSFLTSYVARHTLAPGADPMAVLRITGSVAFATYCVGYFPDSIWKGMPWSNTLKSAVDGAIYALATGMVFRFFWPA
jgi:hypothetical protein